MRELDRAVGMPITDKRCYVVLSRFLQGKRECRPKETVDGFSPGYAFRTSSSFWGTKERPLMTPNPVDLKLRIDEAFGGLPYPGDEHIVTHNCGDCGDCERTKSALKGCHWRDVSLERVENVREALTFLSPEGFRFYLPAFMIISLMDYDRADIIVIVVIGRLTLPCASDFDRTNEQRFADYYRSGEGEHWFVERVSGFDETQSKVIRQFLGYMRDAHSEELLSEDAEKAIERYWHQFSLP
jgi:hypothetical protein